MSESLKFDGDKTKMELLPLESVREIAKVLTFGANKYRDDSWQGLENFEKRYFGACLRHLVQYQSGEKVDEESGISHLAHAGCNILFLIWNELHKEVDNDKMG